MKTKNLFLVTIVTLFGVIVESNGQDNTVYRANVTEPAAANVFIGPASANPNANTTSSYNVAVGNNAGVALTTGGANTFLGNYAGSRITSGANNLFLGNLSGTYCTTGSENIIIGMGHQSYNNENTHFSGGGNVIIGNRLNLYQSAGPFNFFDNPNTTQVDDHINNYIILADGGYGRTTAAIRFLIDDLGRAGLGTFLPKNKLEIKNDNIPNSSGLRFTNLTSSFTPTESATKFLTLDGNGDVILANASTGGNPTGNFWSLTGNSGTLPSLDLSNTTSSFLGTIDDKDLVFRRYGQRAGVLRAGTISSPLGTSLGVSAALPDAGCLYLGNFAGGSTTGLNNTFLGAGAGSAKISGNGNVYIGQGVADSASLLGGAVTESNTLRIHNNNSTPLIFGNFQNRMVRLNVDGSTASGNYLEISSTIGIPNATTSRSGLRFQDYTINTPASTVNPNNNNRFLTLNTTGDVILQDLPTNLGACNLYTCDGALSGNRLVNMASNYMIFNTGGNTTTTGGRIYIGNTTAFTGGGAGTNFPVFLDVDPANTRDYRLYVEGGILTERLKIALRSTSNWADYVFADDHKLMSLKEIEAYVKENKHLPGIQSAEELVKDGLDLGEMQAKQMSKIEELTLHAIELEKQIEKQNNELEELKSQVKSLLERK